MATKRERDRLTTDSRLNLVEAVSNKVYEWAEATHKEVITAMCADMFSTGFRFRGENYVCHTNPLMHNYPLLDGKDAKATFSKHLEWYNECMLDKNRVKAFVSALATKATDAWSIFALLPQEHHDTVKIKNPKALKRVEGISLSDKEISDFKTKHEGGYALLASIPVMAAILNGL